MVELVGGDMVLSSAFRVTELGGRTAMAFRQTCSRHFRL